MARPLRINYPGAFYHVTSRGNERKDVFKSKRDREKGMGVGPQEQSDIINKTLKKCVKYGLKRAFWGPKTHL